MRSNAKTEFRNRTVQAVVGLAAALCVVLILSSGNHIEARNNLPQQSCAGMVNEGQWIEMGIGSASGPGNVDNTGGALSPALAIGQNGVPITAWQDVSSGGSEIYARRWNGAAWEEIGSGSASAGGISSSGTGNDLSLAISPDGTPVIAWRDYYNETGEVYVRRWNGAVWEEMGAGSASGSGISNSVFSAYSPSLAISPDGTPIIAWEDLQSAGPGEHETEIYVRRWSGQIWQEMGAGSASGWGMSNSGGHANSPSLAIGPDGTPVVAWTDWDSSGGDTEIYVRRWNGEEWVEMGIGSASGGGISNNSGYSDFPLLAINPAGTHIIAWLDESGGGNEIYVRRWNGEAWVKLDNGSASGGSLSYNACDFCYFSYTMAISPNSTLLVAWMDYSRTVPEVYLRTWNGADWVEMGRGSASGGGISNSPGTSEEPSLAISPDGTAIIAWEDHSDEGDAVHTYVRRWLSRPKDSYELSIVVGEAARQVDDYAAAEETVPPTARAYLPIIFSGFPPFHGPLEVEPNDEFQQANGPLTFDAIYYGSLTDLDDEQDIYYFNLASAQNVSIKLTDLPEGENLDLLLRDQALRIKGFSANPNNENEEIRVDLSPGLFYVQLR